MTGKYFETILHSSLFSKRKRKKEARYIENKFSNSRGERNYGGSAVPHLRGGNRKRGKRQIIGRFANDLVRAGPARIRHSASLVDVARKNPS